MPIRKSAIDGTMAEEEGEDLCLPRVEESLAVVSGERDEGRCLESFVGK